MLGLVSGFNFFKLLPYLMQAVDLAKQIGDMTKGGMNFNKIIQIIQTKGGEVWDLLKNAGAELFPDLPEEMQAAAGAVRFDTVTTKKIQVELNKLGLASPPLTEDGAYGPLTRETVRKYQEDKGLTADGWAGPETQKALGLVTG